MQNLEIPDVPAVDQAIAEEVQSAIDQKTKPPGALGELEALASKIALAQGTVKPIADGCQLLLFAADHGVAQSGVSAYPQEVTRQMVLNFLEGGAAANVFSSVNEVDLVIVDAGIRGDAIDHPALISARLGEGTCNFIHESAMDRKQLASALQQGVSLGKAAACSFVAFGEMGIGNTSSAAMLVHKIADIPLEQAVGRGTGLDDAGLQNKLSLLRTASERTGDTLAAEVCLREYGGFEIAMMTGAMIGAASQRRCLLIDGYIATAAWLVANAMRPDITQYSVFSHRSAEPGHAALLRKLGEKPLLDLNLRLGEGTGALLAWPLIKCAVHMLNDMATFESSGVSTRS